MESENNQSTTNQMAASSSQKPAKGKKVLAILLVALFFVGTGVGAWWYGSSQAEKKADEQISNLQGQVDDLKKQAATKTEEGGNRSTIKDESEGYLSITQWGIRIRLTDAQYLNYDIVNITANDPSEAKGQAVALSFNTAYPGDRSMPGCDSPGVEIRRYARDADISSSTTKTIGDFKYTFGGAPGVCEDSRGATIKDRVIKEIQLLEITEA